MNAIRIHNYGGPEVLQYEDAPRPQIRKGEVLIRVHAAGVNYLKSEETYIEDAIIYDSNQSPIRNRTRSICALGRKLNPTTALCNGVVFLGFRLFI